MYPAFHVGSARQMCVVHQERLVQKDLEWNPGGDVQFLAGLSAVHKKATGNPVNKRETTRFYEMVDDIKKGDHGTMLADAIYGSSVGFRGDALVELDNLNKSRPNDMEDRLEDRL